MTVNNSTFLIIGFVFAILGLSQRNLAFGIIGLTFMILAFGPEEEEYAPSSSRYAIIEKI